MSIIQNMSQNTLQVPQKNDAYYQNPRGELDRCSMSKRRE
jgi:hypothetical protein